MPLPTKVTDLISALNLIPHPEGGFFIETYRSGSIPMSTQGQTGFNCSNPTKNLINTNDRAQKRPDHDIRRNAITSIHWAPTLKSSSLLLGVNCSDHIHYYQGGLPFKYLLYDPSMNQNIVEEVVLGPDLDKGHKLQVCVPGGVWKCGQILTIADNDDDNNNNVEKLDYEYSLIGEAVAPGFDYHDFTWVKEEQVRDTFQNKGYESDKMMKILLKYIHESARAKDEVVTGKEDSVDTHTIDKDTHDDKTSKEKAFDFAEFYEENELQKNRVQERS